MYLIQTEKEKIVVSKKYEEMTSEELGEKANEIEVQKLRRQ